MFSELGAGVFSYCKRKIHSTKINKGKLFVYSAVYFSRLHCVLTCGKSLEVLGISIGCVIR